MPRKKKEAEWKGGGTSAAKTMSELCEMETMQNEEKNVWNQKYVANEDAGKGMQRDCC